MTSAGDSGAGTGGYTRHPDGPPCLVCHTRTWSEGQLCPGCVDRGHRVENNTLIMNFDAYVKTKPGEHWSLMRPIDNEAPRMTSPPQSPLRSAVEGLRKARAEHEWPVETDDGLDYGRCSCGATPPYSPGGSEDGFWWADHHDEAITVAALAAVDTTVEGTAEGVVERIAEVLLATKDPAGPFPVVRAGCALAAAEAVVAALAAADGAASVGGGTA